MERWRGKIAVVAGASDGIGAEVVKHLLIQKITVVGLARRKEKIEELSDSKRLYALKVDVTIEEEVSNAFTWIKDILGLIHILINTVGVVWYGNLTDSSLRIWKEVYDADVFSIGILSKVAIEHMRENSVDGHIIHIVGIGGHGAYAPYLGVLISAKCAAISAIDSLRRELASLESKIKISSVSPAIVKTNMFGKNIKQQLEFKDYADSLKEEKVALYTSDVADAVMYLLSTPPHVQVDNIQLRAITIASSNSEGLQKDL